jgi:hypothetical protein
LLSIHLLSGAALLLEAMIQQIISSKQQQQVEAVTKRAQYRNDDFIVFHGLVLSRQHGTVLPKILDLIKK